MYRVKYFSNNDTKKEIKRMMRLGAELSRRYYAMSWVPRP